jgi:hypothetical protein
VTLLVAEVGLRRLKVRPIGLSLEELLLALALVAHPAVEVDERLHLVVAGRGGGDDIATVGVADEHDRTGQGAQEFGEVGRVASEIAKRVGESDGAESLALQGAELGVEARRIGPGAVDQHDRGGDGLFWPCQSQYRAVHGLDLIEQSAQARVRPRRLIHRLRLTAC